MTRWWSRGRPGVVVAAALPVMLAIAAGRAQQKQCPYPTLRDQRGTVPPGPRLLPSPPLGEGPFTFQTTEPNWSS